MRMTNYRTFFSIIGIGLLAATSANGAEFNGAAEGIANPSTQAGGTLRLVSTADCDGWDPQRTTAGRCWNLQRLFTRTLVGYAKVNGTKFEFGADLATDLGSHNADFSEWTYTLKPDLKFSTGAPITPNDVRYAISRLWAADVVTGGPASYFTSSIKAPDGYKGVYHDGVNDVGMTTTENTITFHLTGPNADFNYLMTLPAAAPVPMDTEGGADFKGANYGKHPVASGPFMIESYAPNEQITFVRNPNWTQDSDTIRHPLVDKVTVIMTSDPADADARLKAGQVDANISPKLTAAFQAQILSDTELMKNADNPLSTYTGYMAVLQTVIPDVHCRRAIFYAVNKKTILAAYGGTAAGEIAKSFTPVGIEGHDSAFDPYPLGSDGTGNLEKAKEELALCGKPDGFATNMAYPTPSTQDRAAFVALQAALARVGIQLSPKTADISSYYKTFAGSPSNTLALGIGLAIAAGGPDFPTPMGWYYIQAHGKTITDPGTLNFVSLNDPVINELLDNGPAGKNTTADWERLNHEIMDRAVYMPLFFGKNLVYRNPRLTNVTCNNVQAFGSYDFVNVGVGGGE